VSTSELNFQLPNGPVTVPYLGLGGGLNTRLDPHALERNELAVSQNLWPAFDNAVTKRPGSNPIVTTNGVVNTSTHPTKSLLTARFNSQTYLIHIDTLGIVSFAPANGTSTWTQIGTVNPSAAFVTGAQMFDPVSQSQTLFLCDGLSVPQFWTGPSYPLLQTVPTGSGYLPNKLNGSTPITPQYVKTLGNNSHLFYSGDSANPSGVYHSDAFYPTRFNYAAQQVGIDTTNPGSYNMAVIGNNDGVDGGIITGLESLGSAMIVFKEAAVYTMVQTTLLGESPAWQVVEVSNAVGNQAPRSLTRFATFVTFVAVDGIYITDGQTVTQISDDVPTYFDASLNGVPALCTDRTQTQGVRHGFRALFFFPVQQTGTAQYANAGLWFDFAKATRFGHPLAGEIDGMNVGGIVALRGPQDDGNVAWGNAVSNQVGRFGVGNADLDGSTAAKMPIQTFLIGKADLFDDVFGPEVAIAKKQVQDAYALVQVHATTAQQVDFYGEVIVDLGLTLGRVIIQPFNSTPGGGVWGSGSWGIMAWGSNVSQQFQRVKIPFQNGARGYLLQVGIMERSTVPWVMIGYAVRVNAQKSGY
jgi:hypothetical protein